MQEYTFSQYHAKQGINTMSLLSLYPTPLQWQTPAIIITIAIIYYHRYYTPCTRSIISMILWKILDRISIDLGPQQRTGGISPPPSRFFLSNYIKMPCYGRDRRKERTDSAEVLLHNLACTTYIINIHGWLA